jgi:hypothetical protein
VHACAHVIENGGDDRSSKQLSNGGGDRSCDRARAWPCRTGWIKKVNGGVSKLTADILRDIFVDGKADEGWQLQLQAGRPPVTLRIQLRGIIGDEEAVNSIWYTKGASGISPCAMLCSVTNKGPASDRERNIASMTDRDSAIPDLSCSSLEACGLRSDSDIWGFVDMLEACPRGELAEQEHVSGIKLNSNTLLFCRELRPHLSPSQITMYDPMHIIFSCGILGSEIMLCMRSMKDSVGAYFADVRAFLAEHGFLPTKSNELFSETREKSAVDTLKGGASELLASYPLLRAFLIEVYGVNASEVYIKSIMLLFKICDIVRNLLKYPSALEVEMYASELRMLIPFYLQAFTLAYGKDALRFKHHQLLHLPDFLRSGMMVACWVLERKHIQAKHSLQHRKGLDQIEKTGLSRMLWSQIRMLHDPGWLTTLAPPLSDFPELKMVLGASRVQVSAAMRWHGTWLKTQMVTFLDMRFTYLVVVIGCLSFDQSHGLLVKYCTSLTSGDVGSTWQVDDEVKLYRLTNEPVVKPAAWRWVNPNCLEVLH